MYPIRASFLEYVPQSLLAGVIGGVCFLFMAIVLALVTACFMSHRRQKRRIKRRHGKDKNHESQRNPSLLLCYCVQHHGIQRCTIKQTLCLPRPPLGLPEDHISRVRVKNNIKQISTHGNISVVLAAGLSAANPPNVSPPVSRSRRPPRSPDSILKLKLCPALPFFPGSSTAQSDRLTFDKGSRGEYQDQKKQLLSNASPPPHYTLFESHLGCQAPSSTGLESICRGPDGRFLVQPLPEGSSSPSDENMKNVIVQCNGGASGAGSNRTSFRDSPKSSVLSSEKEERKDSPLTVDVAELSRPPSSPGRVKAMARNFSRHGCFYSDDEQGSEALLERASFYSDNSEMRTNASTRRYCLPANADDLLPVLGRRALGPERDVDQPSHSRYQPMERESQLTDGSTLALQT